MNPRFREFLTTATSNAQAAAQVQQAEAARYALIRRLAPSLRHHLVRYLQPIGMIYGVMDHRLSAPEPDLHTLHQDAKKINKFAKAALAQCTDISSWLAPEENIMVPAGPGVQECVSLLAGNLNFRGYQLINAVRNVNFNLRRDSLRSVLAASIIAITDELDAPAKVTLTGRAEIDHLTLSLQIAQSGKSHSESFDDGYRKLVWADVRAIAAVEDVALEVLEDGISMSFVIEPSNPALAHPSH